MNAAPEHVDQLLRHPGLWRGGDKAAIEAVATGFVALDRRLPGGGWPLGALTELMPERAGIGELSLLMPALRRSDRGSAWIAPPHIPYAPSLAAHGVDPASVTVVRAATAADAAWAAEQALSAGVFAAVLIWFAQDDGRVLRRLQLAAEAGRSLAMALRPTTAATGPSPAALRLSLTPHPDGLNVRLIKCRGRLTGSDRLTLSLTPTAIAGL